MDDLNKEFQDSMLDLYVATVAVEQRLPRVVPDGFNQSLPDDLQERVLNFHRKYKALIVNEAQKLQSKLNLPKDEKILFMPCYHCGLGDWVLINQLMLCVKQSYPDHKLVVAVREMIDYQKFYKDIMDLNPHIDHIIEVPLYCETNVNAHTILWAANEYGMRAIVWAESLLLELLRPYKNIAVYRYSRFPYMLNYKNNVNVTSHAQHLLDLEDYIHNKNIKPYLSAPEDAQESASEYLKQQGCKDDDLVLVMHAKFEEDFHHYISVLDMIAEKYPIKVIRMGFEGNFGVERDWLCDIDPTKSSLKFLAGLMSQADLFVGNISGPMHLAASLGLSCVALYFKEHTGLEWRPKLPKDKYVMLYKKAIGHDGLEIKHRTDYGFKNKNVKEFIQIPQEELYKAIDSMLEKRGNDER